MRLLEIKLQKILRLPLLFALFGFFSCVILSVVYNFEDATKTHCNVPNFIPSISTSIGDFRPQAYIWRICIALHCFPRLVVSFLYYNYYTLKSKNPMSNKFRILNGLNTLLTIIENLALLILTYVSSRENFGIHENAFITFMVCSMCYMLTTCTLFKWTSGKPMTNDDKQSFKRKMFLMVTNYSSFALAVYFYFRHNWYCEPGSLLCLYAYLLCLEASGDNLRIMTSVQWVYIGDLVLSLTMMSPYLIYCMTYLIYVYSLFALCEYSAVLSNIFFHQQSYYLVEDTYLLVIDGHQPLNDKGMWNV